MKVSGNFIIDAHGKKIAVMLDISEYKKILVALEELESLKAYDAAKSSADEIIPFKDAIKEIEKKRKKR